LSLPDWNPKSSCWRHESGNSAGAAADIRQALSLCKRLPELRGSGAFHSACAPAALARLAGREGAGVSAAEGTAAADWTMALLRNAVHEGRRDLTECRGADALDALHGREDFKKLLAELEKPSPDRPKK
jgi:hypothetical protein